MTTNRPRPRITFIEDLCNELPEKKVREAEDTFWACLEIVKRIAEREHAQTASQVVRPHDSTFSDSESLIQSVRD